MPNAEQVLLFDAFFSVLLIFFGAAVTNTNLQQFTFIPAPPISPQPSLNTGGTFNPLAGLIQATAFIGWAIVNIPVLAVWGIGIIIQFINVIDIITFSPGASISAVPVIGFLWIAMQIIVLFEVFRLFRGNASGGTM